MQSSERRFSLRERTRAHHSQLDEEIGDLDSLEVYKRYLKGMFLFRSGFELCMQEYSFPPAFGSWRPVAITPALQADMSDLGMMPATHATSTKISNVSALLGILYVVEGSALGARLLRRQAEALGYDAQFGARHLAGQTDNPDSWRSFQTILESASPFDLEVAAEAAGQTFDDAHRIFISL